MYIGSARLYILFHDSTSLKPSPISSASSHMALPCTHSFSRVDPLQCHPIVEHYNTHMSHVLLFCIVNWEAIFVKHRRIIHNAFAHIFILDNNTPTLQKDQSHLASYLPCSLPYPCHIDPQSPSYDINACFT